MQRRRVSDKNLCNLNARHFPKHVLCILYIIIVGYNQRTFLISDKDTE